MRLQALTRRQLLQGAAAGVATGVATPRFAAPSPPVQRRRPGPYAAGVLPRGVRSRFVAGVNGLRMHVLEAGLRAGARASVLLLHGFPELAYSWRRLMPALAAAGYHVMAPDLRGYGRTDGTDVRYDDDLRPFRMLNQVRDMLALVSAFGYRRVHLAGHDFGSLVASWCAVARPDVFRSVVLMSAPFGGTATLPFTTAAAPRAAAGAAGGARLPARLLPHEERRLERQPPAAAPRVVRRRAGPPAPLLRPGPRQGMAETVAEHMPSAAEIAACEWLPDDELRVYSAEYRRTGFQGGLQWYRSVGSVSSIFGGGINADLQVFAGRTIDQPSLFIAGPRDWASTSAPAPSSAWKGAPAPTCGACTSWRGPGTGCSRSSRPRSTGW